MLGAQQEPQPAMPSDYTLHDATGRLFAQVFGMMRREFDAELREHGVTITEWVVLASLHSGGVETPSDIARYGEIDRSVVTRALDRLTEKSLTKRDLNPEDRRSFTIRLTPAGRRVAKALLDANKRINERYLRGLSKAEVRELRRMLKHILGNGPSPIDVATRTSVEDA